MHRPLRFDDVSIRYAPDLPFVFQSLSFRMPERGVVAVTGPSGSGKTTLALAAVGVVVPASGRILYGDRTIGQLGAAYVREYLVTLVLQEPSLYGRTIRESLTLGRDIPDDAILRWLEPFGLTRFYRRFPNGLDSSVSDLIAQASAGEMQRLGIIRGFLRDTPIIILDEPTSHLDAETERIVSAAIHEFAQEHTVIAISHRTAPIKDAVLRIRL